MKLLREFRPIKALLNENTLNVLTLNSTPGLREKLNRSIAKIGRELNLAIDLTSDTLSTVRYSCKVAEAVDKFLSEPSNENLQVKNTQELLSSFHSIYTALVNNVSPTDASIVQFIRALNECLVFTASEYEVLSLVPNLIASSPLLAASLLASIIYSHEDLYYLDKPFGLISVKHLRSEYNRVSPVETVEATYYLILLSIPTTLLQLANEKEALVKLVIQYYSEAEVRTDEQELLKLFTESLTTL